MTAYAELVAATGFSFLRGASLPKEMVAAALLMGHDGIGIADRNTVSGVVRAWAALREMRRTGALLPDRIREGDGPGVVHWLERAFPTIAGEHLVAPDADSVRAAATRFKLITGARLVFADGTPDIVAHPANRAGWGRLTKLLTLGNRRSIKGLCELHLADLLADAQDLLLILMPPRRAEGIESAAARLAEAAPGSAWIAATMHRRGDDRRRLARLQRTADTIGLPLIATNDALYADPGQRDLQDVMTCIREGVTIDRAGRRLQANAERHLKFAIEMERLFADAPHALEAARELRERVDFDLDQLRYQYPDEPVPPGWTPQAYLEHSAWAAASARYPAGIPAKVERQIAEELELIEERDYARYFLTIKDIVQFAERRGILCQGRGSAANSAVCFVLGITAVDPAENDLLFARFVSAERNEPPDIDVDFEHERREEVIQHIYDRYGRDRAAIAATVIHYRPRSAIRDVGKVLGLSEDITARLSSLQWGSWGTDIPHHLVARAGLDANNPVIARAVALAERLLTFPRHLSQHVGGFVLTRGRLDEIVPIGNGAMPDRTFLEWDKDDIDALGLMKVDILALGMLTCIRKAFDLIALADGTDPLQLHEIPQDDPVVYDMLSRGDSLGVFQVESRAQMNMLPRLKPRRLYDLVIQVAIVRPGPIQGDMVHPYLRRRAGLEPVIYPTPSPEHPQDELEQVLGKTLGVPLFQEQAMRVAIVAAKFTPEQANQLRKAMATFRHVGTIGQLEQLFVGNMIGRGYVPEFAQRCFDQIKGFGSYGFPESHAASFAKLVYISSWIKCHHPAAFACALLNAQPMGFYAPAQIVRDAAEHDVEIRPIDINHSDWDNSLERRDDGALAVRLGFRQIDGLHQADAQRLVAGRGAGYASVEVLAARARLNARAMRLLADADAFRSIGSDRRAALWAVRRLPGDDPLPLFAAADARELGADVSVELPEMPLPEQIATDYQTTRLSLKGHPMGMLRGLFAAEGVLSSAQANALKDGRRARVAGVVLVRQRPGNGKAIFVTLEDETGITNVIMWARTFETFRAEVMGSRLMLVEGQIQKSPEGVIHLMVDRVIDRSAELSRLSDDRIAEVPLCRADIGLNPQPPPRGWHPRDVRVLPKSRDFH
ncbi:error-prone DNA polymerase [Sphingomonas sp. 1P06PA]|uniref:error-prone DNA polymerase n=1 Tax=Sphingomonas sp. 1P06PA TaxID=554121 RepID=UPI0039A6DCE5